MPQIAKPLLDRFVDKIELAENGCWNWTAQIDHRGYGIITERGTYPKKWSKAHRISYEMFVGDIQPGYEIHHECYNKKCVNPNHLKPMVVADHARIHGFAARNLAKTHCPYGHPLDDKNTFLRKLPSGRFGRLCKVCKNRKRIFYKRQASRRARGLTPEPWCLCFLTGNQCKCLLRSKLHIQTQQDIS